MELFQNYVQRLRRPVEDCPHRQPVVGDPQHALCRLLRQVTGVSEEDAGLVGLDACRACCECFAPSTVQINPVVASLVHGLATRVIDQGGLPTCSERRARDLRRWAEANLEIVCTSDRRTVIPARITERCCYLGSPVLPDQDVPPGQVAHHCAHPEHRRTTPDECRLCCDWSDLPGLVRVPLESILPPPSSRHEPVVKTWGVGVTTAPRRQPTLEWCLDSLARAGWTQPRLFIDSPVEIPQRYAHLPATVRQTRVGAWPNYYLALAELLMREPEADAYLLVQDDALFYDRQSLRAHLEEMLWPEEGVGVVSLYCSSGYAHPQPGWHRYDGLWVLGAVAFVFSRAAAQSFMTDPGILAHRWQPGNDGLVNIDIAIGEWCQRQGVAVYYPSPSLAQHVGETSTLWPEAPAAGLRCANQFAGDDRRALATDPELARFPEDRLRCDPAWESAYREALANGTERMRRSTAVICGLARDLGGCLARTMARIERLGAMFREYRVIVYENDSLDDTRLVLHLWAERNPQVSVFTEKLGEPRFGQTPSVQRTSRMAYYRNRCRQAVLETCHDMNACLVVDMDLIGGWSYDGVAHTFGQEDWDAVGSLSLQRTERLVDGERVCEWTHFDTFAFRGAGGPADPQALLGRRRGGPLTPVESCFGGLGVYRMAAFAAGEYGGDDCEHVKFHRRLADAGYGRIFLNTSQVTLYSELTDDAATGIFS
ncbi:MAG: hypothetical protein ACKV0T_03720 [Planctomycetales bacterium]